LIRNLYDSLPGPATVRVLQMLVAVAIIAVLVLLLYEWLGSTLFDSGGTVG